MPLYFLFNYHIIYIWSEKTRGNTSSSSSSNKKRSDVYTHRKRVFPMVCMSAVSRYLAHAECVGRVINLAKCGFTCEKKPKRSAKLIYSFSNRFIVFGNPGTRGLL